MEMIFLAAGILIGIILGWLAVRLIYSRKSSDFLKQLSGIEKEKIILEERLNIIRSENDEINKALTEERKKADELSKQVTAQEVEFKNLQEKNEKYLRDFEEIYKKSAAEFENIAHKILKQNTEEFTLKSNKNLGDILNPLREKIETFEKKVADTYEKGLKDQTDLRAELKNLHELNKRISEEARNLTNALKSDTKKQGNWGELILERVLEKSGLTRGEEYYTQYTDRNEDGELIRPDVIVNLPDNKHIVIDSKVSLVAYDMYVNPDNEELRDRHLKSHIESIKDHVKILSEKKYQLGSKLDSPDFVLLFLPIESAFSLAIQTDPGLFNYAWDRKIVIVSPTTLLATLKTVESIWKHEKQTQNALEIARQGGNLYDKFVSFLTDLERLGVQLSQTQKTYQEAHKKLSSGSGNLIGRVEKLRKLGAKASKEIPVKLINKPEEEDNEE